MQHPEVSHTHGMVVVMAQMCSISGCDRPVLARSWCSSHYSRWRTSGDPGTAAVRELQTRDGPCLVDGCDRPRKSRGYCGAHYWRVRTYGTPGEAVVQARRNATCSVPECERRTVGRGLCRMHYERQRKGRPLGGAQPQRRPSGQGSVLRGYRVVTVAKGRTRLEHRVLMEQLLGRPLLRHETVHHVNGNRLDNTTAGELDEAFRCGNLELWSTWQPAGQRVSDKVAYARQLLSAYAPELLAQPVDGCEPT